MIDYQLHERTPTVDEFLKLRKAVEWGYPDDKSTRRGLKNSVYCICADLGNEIIGIGRIVGDFGFTYLICDMMILPKYQRQGIGTKIMEMLMNYLNTNASEKAYIALMAAKGKEPFYERFGFWKRPNEYFGHGMMMFLEKKNRRH